MKIIPPAAPPRIPNRSFELVSFAREKLRYYIIPRGFPARDTFDLDNDYGVEQKKKNNHNIITIMMLVFGVMRREEHKTRSGTKRSRVTLR